MVGGKGRGSNLLNLIEAGRDGRMRGQVELVVGTKEGVPAVEMAREMGVRTVVLSPKEGGYGGCLRGVLRESAVDLVCLAGYLTLLPGEVLVDFPGRVLNIHPALLPKFGGKGMYLHYVHEAVLAAGESESGCSVHMVSEQYDEGAVVWQERVPVEPGDTVETLGSRVNRAEMVAYPKAVNLVWEKFGG